MWTEEYEAKGFPLRNFLLKLVFVVVFLLLLVFIVSKFTTPKLSIPKENLTTITDEVFLENIEKMKTTATDFYRKKELPKKEGETVKLLLSDMIQSRIIVPLADKDDKVCNINKSYVEIKKLAVDYLMKVNLKCGKVEDYVLIPMGSYSYCETAICEKKKSGENA